jgi:hypothetical protein
MPDLDLDSLKRSIDLTQYARSIGYQERPHDAVPGITVLEHERLGDRIAVARLASGGIYARIPDYPGRGAGESDELAHRRLRDCITRSRDTGSIVEFVRSNERRAGRPEPDVERVREHLTTWHQVARTVPHALEHPPDPNAFNRRIGDWRPSPAPHDLSSAPEVQARLRRWQEAQNALDRKLTRSADRIGPASPPAPSRTPDRSARSELAVRRYDWSPQPLSHPSNQLGRNLRGRGGPERDR